MNFENARAALLPCAGYRCLEAAYSEMDRRGIVFIAANALLLLLLGMVNSRLAGWGVFLFVAGLFPVLPTLYLRSASAVVCALVTGLFADALFPGALPGFFTLGLVAAVLLVHPWRNRFRWELNIHALLIASALNLVFCLGLGIAAVFEQTTSAGFFIRMIFDWMVSQLLIFGVGPWFFDLQRAALYWLGFKTEAEDAPIR